MEQDKVQRNKWGQRLCEPHGNQADKCNTPPCHGVGICDCGIQRSLCKTCGGGALCECGVVWSSCAKCGIGGSLCDCDPPKRKRQCKKCMPSTYYAGQATHGIRMALKRNQKECKYDKVLGMSVGDYRTWIEARWTNKEWTWENYGTDWVIDHIEPLSLKANKDLKEPAKDDIVRRLHYSNSQPLGKTENLRKATKIVVASAPNSF